jgi:beta-lactamase regulating signal transducer with metallopeptidase domain
MIICPIYFHYIDRRIYLRKVKSTEYKEGEKIKLTIDMVNEFKNVSIQDM